MKFSDKFHALRQRLHLTLPEFAEALNISRSTVINAENGMEPTLRTLTRFNDLMAKHGLTEKDLETGTGPEALRDSPPLVCEDDSFRYNFEPNSEAKTKSLEQTASYLREVIADKDAVIAELRKVITDKDAIIADLREAYGLDRHRLDPKIAPIDKGVEKGGTLASSA